jgi:SAM-dependent methyltransferase
MDLEKVQHDFDELAHLSGGDSGSDRYDPLLLKLVPAGAENVLEVGCGSGRFTELLAKSNQKVTAIDLSPEMIARARERFGPSDPVSFYCGDFLEENFNSQKFDCIISAATLHHMSAELAVPRMKELLGPGGTLIIHDLRTDAGITDFARSGAAFSYDCFRRLLRTGNPRQPRHVREFWERHASGETYLTIKEAKTLAVQWLPGARVLYHWLWRYTIVWKKEIELIDRPFG